jgi:hypothetical protein
MLSPVVNYEQALPACVTRDHLTSRYFPNTSRGMLAIIAVLCGVFLLTSFNRLHHTDLWGHLAYGRWIAEHGTLPTSDPLGAHPNSQGFTNTAWLAQWLGYETHRVAGEEGLVLGHALLATMACGVLMAAVRARGVSLFAAAWAGAAVYLLALPITGTIRPQLFGMVGFSCVLLACSQLPTKRHPLYWLPLVMLIWANLHGSFLMGLVVLGLFAVSTLFSAETSTLRARSWLLLGCCLAAICVNPLGPTLLAIVAGFGRNEVLASISEWAALSTEKKLTLTLFTSSALLGCYTLWASPRQKTWFELALVLLFGIATVFAIRMLVWWAFVWPWVMLPHLAAIFTQWRSKRAMPVPADEPTAMQTLMGVACVFTSLLVAPCSHAMVSGHARGLTQVCGQSTPLYVGEEIARRQLTGKMFAPMDWADYLIWTSQTRLQPLVYTHVHLVSPTLWNDYMRIAAGDGAWETLARQHELRYVLADRDPKRKSELHRLVWQATRGEKATARIVYQDQKCVLVELLPK